MDLGYIVEGRSTIIISVLSLFSVAFVIIFGSIFTSFCMSPEDNAIYMPYWFFSLLLHMVFFCLHLLINWWVCFFNGSKGQWSYECDDVKQNSLNAISYPHIHSGKMQQVKSLNRTINLLWIPPLLHRRQAGNCKISKATVHYNNFIKEHDNLFKHS